MLSGMFCRAERSRQRVREEQREQDMRHGTQPNRQHIHQSRWTKFDKNIERHTSEHKERERDTG